MNKKLITITAVVAIAAFAAAAGLRFEARLSGQGKGKAKWQVANRGGEFQGELEVEGERMRRNSDYTIHVAGQDFAVTTNGFGAFEMAARFTDRTTAPLIGTGTSVSITDANGNTVMSGVFAQR